MAVYKDIFDEFSEDELTVHDKEELGADEVPCYLTIPRTISEKHHQNILRAVLWAFDAKLVNDFLITQQLHKWFIYLIVLKRCVRVLYLIQILKKITRTFDTEDEKYKFRMLRLSKYFVFSDSASVHHYYTISSRVMYNNPDIQFDDICQEDSLVIKMMFYLYCTRIKEYVHLADTREKRNYIFDRFSSTTDMTTDEIWDENVLECIRVCFKTAKLETDWLGSGHIRLFNSRKDYSIVLKNDNKHCNLINDFDKSLLDKDVLEKMDTIVYNDEYAVYCYPEYVWYKDLPRICFIVQKYA